MNGVNYYTRVPDILSQWNVKLDTNHLNNIFIGTFNHETPKLAIFSFEHRHVNHPPLDHHYKCHENTNRSRVSQFSKAPIPTSKLMNVQNTMQV